MNQYSNIIRKIATEQQLTLVDMRKAFEEYEKIHNTTNLDRGLSRPMAFISMRPVISLWQN